MMKFRGGFFLSGLVKILVFITFLAAGQSPAADLTVAERTAADQQQKAQTLSRQWIDASIRQSIALYRESSEDWKLIKRYRNAAECLRESAKLSQMLSDNQGSLADLKKALIYDRKINDIDGKVISLSLMSLVQRQLGNAEESRILSQRAMNLSKFSKNDSALTYLYMSAGTYQSFYGDVAKSVGLFERAFSHAAKSGDADLLAESLLNLGYAKARLDNPLLAMAHIENALEICRKSGSRRCLALSYFGLGFLNSLMDEKQTALNYFKRAEELFPTDFEWQERAKLYSNISSVYEDLGELELAETYSEKAFVFFEKANYAHGKLAILPNLARFKHLKGDKTASVNLYDKGLKLAEKLNDKFYSAYLKEGLGDLYLTFEQYDAAISNYRQALKVYESLKVTLPNIKISLGKAFEKKGDLAAAEKYYALALNQNRSIKSDQSASECLFRIAGLSKIRGNAELSLQQIKESLKITDFLYEDVSNSNLKRNFFSNVFDRYEFFINLSMQMRTRDKNFVIQALQAAEKSRARAMLENLTLSEADLIKDADAATINRQQEIRALLNAKADKLTDVLSHNADKAATEKLENEINELDNELEDIRATLKQNSPLYSAIRNPAPFDVAEFQQNILDDDSLLLEFSFGTEESYLWLIGKNEFEAYILPPRAAIESKIQTLRELLASQEMPAGESVEDFQTRIAAADTKYAEIAKQLSRELFGQIADKFGGKRLIIVPDGKLAFFPVSALPLPGGETGEPILLTNEVVYEPSASTLTILANKTKKAQPPEKSLLVFSDPVFTANDARLSSDDKTEVSAQPGAAEHFRFVESLNSLVRLGSSKTEADSIIEILGAANADSFSGFAANRRKLLEMNVADYKILHFATHGVVDEKRPELSGIVLSRFDESGQNVDEFFRLHDIYGMNLNSDLVVLSACNTGIGKEVKGEGLMSLNNAFLAVGAKTVAASLWKVEDGATLELMKNFYAGLANDNLPPPQALRQAQMKLRQNPQYQSPFYWAAFTVQGDFRNAAPLDRASHNRFPALLFTVFLFAAFYVLRRKFIVRR